MMTQDNFNTLSNLPVSGRAIPLVKYDYEYRSSFCWH